MTMTIETGVRSLTTGRVCAGTRPIVSLYRRSTAESVIGMTETCMTSSTVEMHMTGSKTGAQSESTLSRSGTMKGTVITIVLSMTNLTNNAPLKEGIMQEESKHFPMT
jgi:hypothetical protein